MSRLVPTKETLTVEFKSDRKKYSDANLFEDVVAFANTEGGDLYLGIEDDGYITGVHPFLQKEMINFATSLPQWMRLKNNTDKYVIRKAMAGRIPDQVIRRKKITLADFSYNEIIWPLYERYNMYFMTDYIQDIGIFSEGYLKQSITNLGKAKNTSQLFELKNIILTHISLSSFIDQYNLIL